MSSSMFWKIISYYLPIFFSDVYGLSLSSTALLIFVTRIWDVVSDPIVGVIVDRTDTQRGKYRPYLLWFAVPFAIAGCLLFTTPAWGETGKLIWAYVTYILMTTVYSAINVPYASMLCLISDDSNERTLFSCYRMFFAFVGGFLAMCAWEPLCDLFACGTDILSLRDGWMYAMYVISFLGICMFLASYTLTREHLYIRSTSSLFHDFRALFTNRPWWALTCVAMCTNLFNAIRATTVAYYFKYYTGETANIDLGFTGFLFFAGLFLAVGEVCSMAGVLLTPSLSMRFGKRNTFMASSIVLTILSVVFFYLPSSNVGFIAMLVIQILISVATGFNSPLVWSMYSAVSDYSIVKQGISSIGLIFSTGSMAQKCGGAVAGVLVLWIFDLAGLVPNAISQSENAVWAVKMSMSYLPAAVSFIMVLALCFYPKDKEMRDINKEIRENMINE